MPNGWAYCSTRRSPCGARKRFESRTKAARLRHDASLDDVDYQVPRGLDRSLFLKLGSCDWIRSKRNLRITESCGVGKSYLTCALRQKACREELSVAYHLASQLFAMLALGRSDGRYAKMLRALSRASLLIIDYRGPEALSADRRRDLLETVEDRYDRGSILITSQIPVDRWYEIIGNPALADAILDRVIHNAYRIDLTRESLPKRRASPLES